MSQGRQWDLGAAKSAMMSATTPLLSVVIAVFNGEKTLGRALRSIIEQSYKNVEIIVIDGHSADGTLDIIKQHEAAIAAWVSEPDTGIYDAWNKGVRLAHGEWVAFLGADDTYRKDALESYVSYIKREKPATLEFVSSRVALVDAQDREFRIVGSRWSWVKSRKYMNVAHPGALHHRNLFNRYGLFDPSYRIAGDYEMLLRAGSALRAGFIDRVTVRMRSGGISTRSLRVFSETFRAKRTSGGMGWLSCTIDKWIAIFKYYIRAMVFAQR